MTIPDIRIRGVRQTIPPGYMIGRVGSVDGPVGLVSLSDLSAQLATAPGFPNPVALLVNEFLGFYGEGLFSASQIFQMPITPEAITFPSTSALATQSKAWCQSPPTGNFTLVLVNNLAAYLANGTVDICTVEFLAGQITATFTYVAGPFILPQYSQLWIVMPAATDATMAGLYIQFAGDEA